MAERSQVQLTLTSILASVYPVGLGMVKTVDGSVNTLPEEPLCS